MLSILPGIGGVILITLVAGGIAYIGDRVGHQVGRKRLTMFGLRPKYTSTIVAVGTGMLIALSVTLIALIASSYVRTAFFRIGQLSTQINQLQSQALAQENELRKTRSDNIVLGNHQLIAPPAVIDLSRPERDQLRAFSAFFDETVRYVNSTYTRVGLQPYRKTSSDPEIRANLTQVLHDARDREAALGSVPSPALFVPVAAQNLFRGETISFYFPSWTDRQILRSGEEVASVDVEGGRPIAPPDYQRLQARAFAEMTKRQFPAPLFALGTSGFDPVKLQTANAELARVKGRFRLVARSETAVYPHTGGFILAVTVDPARG